MDIRPLNLTFTSTAFGKSNHIATSHSLSENICWTVAEYKKISKKSEISIIAYLLSLESLESSEAILIPFYMHLNNFEARNTMNFRL